jgi:hypothetical protein
MNKRQSKNATHKLDRIRAISDAGQHFVSESRLRELRERELQWHADTQESRFFSEREFQYFSQRNETSRKQSARLSKRTLNIALDSPRKVRQEENNLFGFPPSFVCRRTVAVVFVCISSVSTVDKKNDTYSVALDSNSWSGNFLRVPFQQKKVSLETTSISKHAQM